ncbi:MAG: hypothetical protein AAGK32_14275 [Actinomycetota bacterium]
MRRGLIGLVAALALLAGACGSDDDTLSESEVRDQLVQSGMPEDLADCVAKEIGSVSAGDEEEIFDKAFDAGQKCASEQLEEELPDISIPDISVPDISIDLE